MKRILLILLSLNCVAALAQDAIEYQKPPKEIYDLVMAKPTPAGFFNSTGDWMVIEDLKAMPSIEELARPELRIAGLRIDPDNVALTRTSFFINLTLKNLKTGTVYPITGLPLNLKAGNLHWSPDEKKLAFTQINNNGIDLYVVDVNNRKAAKINKTSLNLLLGNAFEWMDNNTILYKSITSKAAQAPRRPMAPKGPVIQQSLGKVAASPTYQDLIKTPFDESLFEFYSTSQLIRNVNGIETKIGSPAIYMSFDPSPDKQYLLIHRIDKPFSYLVPAYGFNSTIYITDNNGKEIKQIAKIPSWELAPIGNDNELNAPRDHSWLDNEPSTLSWIEPLDSGLIKKKMDLHDALFILRSPFTGISRLIARTPMRISLVSSVNDNIVLVSEITQSKHRERLSRLNPATGEMIVLNDRSTDDAYNDPGTPIKALNNFGRESIRLIHGNQVFFEGTGSSPKGDLPFLSSFNLDTKENKILWRCEEPFYEKVVNMVDFDKLVFITNRQNQTEPPNYFIHYLVSGMDTHQLTNFTDPQPGLRSLTKQKIMYKRKDGVDLAADLYLPKDYDSKKDGPLPVFMWAYPREFKSASDAAQLRGSKYTFTRVSPGSPIYWATRGFAVMDNTEFPIVGEGDKHPNDNFVDQLAWNAEAAINKVVEMGVGDRNRVAVGGHSYGAFMTVNLLAHTKLFKAGIARSGAYNRTLTPFGFQNEDRTYWEAPEVYYNMSPFNYADKIKTPLLMIHGEADNNQGTFPIQSERLYNAIKGHGGTVRFVLLPFEAHGYAARENVLHMLWEMDQWLSTYVKNNIK